MDKVYPELHGTCNYNYNLNKNDSVGTDYMGKMKILHLKIVTVFEFLPAGESWSEIVFTSRVTG